VKREAEDEEEDRSTKDKIGGRKRRSEDEEEDREA
jgi:hypothetical protein